MKKTLYLMRHGQTRFNMMKKVQGSCDSPLTETGIAQAHIAKKYFETQAISFDAAYCSTQERASDTLEIITDLPYTRLKALKEWDFGLFEGESEALNPKHTPGVPHFDDFFVAYDGEHFETVQTRMETAMQTIMQQDNHDTVLAVSHAGACYSFYLKRNTREELPGQFPNCCILKYEYEDGEFTFIEIIQHDFSSLSIV
ncbi:MAG: histidine phosphatase family protein [Culicoidibacterales bacterium]